MPFITDEQRQALHIQRMTFHVVGKIAGRPLLLDQVVDVGPHEQFFISRVADTLKGALYDFQEIAGTRAALVTAARSEAAFVEQTQNLARRFQAMYDTDQRLSDGVLLVLQLRAGAEELFDIIKFDHDPAVAYRLRQNAGRRQAVLAEISDHFSRHREAMQKSALIRINPAGGGEVCAVDRSGRVDITAPFQAFLDVRRRFDHAELTGRISDILYSVGMKHQHDLPADVVRSLRHRTREALTRIGEIDPQNHEPILTAVFGPLEADHPLRRTFHRQLERQNIADEPIQIDVNALPPTRRLMKETQEGIQIFVPPGENNRIDEIDAGGGERYVRIRTAGLRYDDVEIQRPNRRGQQEPR